MIVSNMRFLHWHASANMQDKSATIYYSQGCDMLNDYDSKTVKETAQLLSEVLEAHGVSVKIMDDLSLKFESKTLLTDVHYQVIIEQLQNKHKKEVTCDIVQLMRALDIPNDNDKEDGTEGDKDDSIEALNANDNE